MLWSGRLYAWFIAVLDRSSNVLRSLLRVPPATHRHVHSPEEIGLLIAESRDGGLLEPQEQVRLHRALRLGLRNARQLMVPRDRLAAIEIKTSLGDVLRIVAHQPVQPAAGLPRLARRHRRHPAHEGRRHALPATRPHRDARRADQADPPRARDDGGRSPARASCASGAATRRWSSTRPGESSA